MDERREGGAEEHPGQAPAAADSLSERRRGVWAGEAHCAS
jgi:hypothetical protein